MGTLQIFNLSPTIIGNNTGHFTLQSSTVTFNTEISNKLIYLRAYSYKVYRIFNLI